MASARHAAMVLTDAQEPVGKIIDISPGAETLLGYSREAVAGQSPAQFIAPMDLPTYLRLREQVMSKKQGMTTQMHLLHRNGTVFPALINADPLFNALHQVTGSFAIITPLARNTSSPQQPDAADEEQSALLESMHENLTYQDTDLRILWANRSALEALGLPREKVIGRHCYELWQGLDHVCENCPVAAALETGRPREHEMSTPDHNIWQVRGFPVRNREGQVVGVVETARRITERKHTEHDLRMQRDVALALAAGHNMRDTLQHLLETCLTLQGIDSGGIYTVDEKEGRLNLVAHAGLTEAFIEQNLRFDMDDPVTQIILKGQPVYGSYQDILQQIGNGHARTREDIRSGAMIPIRCEHRIVAALMLASHTADTIHDRTRDIIETLGAEIGGTIVRLQAEQALRRSRENFRSMYDAISDLVFIVDTQGQLIHWNRMVEQRLGYSPDELAGRSVLELHLPEDTPRARQLLEEVIAKRRSSFVLPLLTRDGTAVPAETRINQGLWDDQEALFGISRDISDRVRVEERLREYQERLEELVQQRTAELRQANIHLENEISERRRTEQALNERRESRRALSVRLQDVREEERTNIARAIHDELGATLTAIKMDVAWLQRKLNGFEEERTAPLAARTGTLLQEIDSMIQLVREISTELRPGVLDTIGLVGALEWQTNEFRKRTGMRCVLKLQEGIDLDPDRSTALFRIYQEILTNIARHSGANTVRTTLEERDDMLVLEVADNGRGITETETTGSEAIGVLGMRERAHVFGGEVLLQGVPDRGTTVRVLIPAGKIRQAEKEKQ